MAVLFGYINAMSVKKADGIRFVSAITRPLVEHIIKLLIIDSKSGREHWVKEVDNWLREISSIRLKPKDKPLKATHIQDAIFKTPFFLEPDGYEMDIRIRNEYKRHKQFNTDITTLQQQITEIIKEFSYLVEARAFKETSSIVKLESFNFVCKK